jgi:hypothetical protein
VAGSKSLGDKWADITTAHGRLMQHGTQGRAACFGLLGLFLGPVIMAAVLTVWREWLIPPQAKS